MSCWARPSPTKVPVNMLFAGMSGYVRKAARQMLQRPLECEVNTFLAEPADRTDEKGR